ncbi:MAG: efflux RND transporter permease subunit [Pseudolabrys sp.]
MPGATDVQVQSPPGLPKLVISLRKSDLERWGFDPVAVLDVIRTAYRGDVVGQTYQGNQVSDVMVQVDDATRRNVAAVGDLPLRSPGGIYVRLRQIADIRLAPGRYSVSHIGARTLETVTADVAGTDFAAFVAKARKAVAANVHLPAGVYLEFTDAAAAQSRSQRDLAINALIAGVGIVLLLSIVTRNRRQLLLVLTNLPFALVGGVLAVYATGGRLSLGALVGFVALFGITLRNSILMIAHYQHLVEEEGASWGLATACCRS